jgi:hypothetical protein
MKKTILGLCVLAIMTNATFASAADVFITRNGKKYHKPDCEFIKDRSPVKIDEAEAVKKGLKPCGACFTNKPLENKSK